MSYRTMSLCKPNRLVVEQEACREGGGIHEEAEREEGQGGGEEDRGAEEIDRCGEAAEHGSVTIRR